MKLLLTLPHFWPHVVRGTERIAHGLAREMARRGHAVTLVTQTPRHRIERSTAYGVPVWYVPELGRVQGAVGLEYATGFALSAAVARLLSDADVANSLYLTDAWGVTWASRLRRRPVVVGVHGIVERRWWQKHYPRTERRFARALAAASAVTALSVHAAERLEADYGVPVTVAYPGIDLDGYPVVPVPDGPRRIVCTAAVDDVRKRVDVLVDAVALLVRDQPDLRLDLVGPGDPGAVLRRAAAHGPAVAERIRHEPPPPDPRRLADRLAGATVGVLPSEREGFGMAALEYLAAGRPAVVCGDAGAREIVTEATGVVVPPNDPVALAEGILQALDLACRAGTVEVCRERAAWFEWSRRGDVYEALYRRVVG